MQTENIEFTFKLGLINIYSPIPVKITLNGQVINELSLGPTSNSINFIASLTSDIDYTLAFTVEEITRPSKITLNNLNVSWLDDNRVLNPSWRAPSPNEVWNYTDPNATIKQQSFVRKVQNIDLDYFVAGTPGYLKKFGRFEATNGSTMFFNKLERPFGITEAGSFKIDFKAPISYWLYSNLA